jgi:hypothetical protein
MNRRLLDPQARIHCLGRSEEVRRGADPLQNRLGEWRWVRGSRRALAPLIGSRLLDDLSWGVCIAGLSAEW